MEQKSLSIYQIGVNINEVDGGWQLVDSEWTQPEYLVFRVWENVCISQILSARFYDRLCEVK